jgi:hypothetical protein
MAELETRDVEVLASCSKSKHMAVIPGFDSQEAQKM